MFILHLPIYKKNIIKWYENKTFTSELFSGFVFHGKAERRTFESGECKLLLVLSIFVFYKLYLRLLWLMSLIFPYTCIVRMFWGKYDVENKSTSEYQSPGSKYIISKRINIIKSESFIFSVSVKLCVFVRTFTVHIFVPQIRTYTYCLFSNTRGKTIKNLNLIHTLKSWLKKGHKREPILKRRRAFHEEGIFSYLVCKYTNTVYMGSVNIILGHKHLM